MRVVSLAHAPLRKKIRHNTVLHIAYHKMQQNIYPIYNLQKKNNPYLVITGD